MFARLFSQLENNWANQSFKGKIKCEDIISLCQNKKNDYWRTEKKATILHEINAAEQVIVKTVLKSK